MTRLKRMLCSGMLVLAGMASTSIAAEKVGQAVKINVTITGQAGTMTTGDAVHRNERVRANQSGVGQFVFDDGSKLAIGPNASIVIDRYVLGEGGKVKRLTLKATKGTFRWISGKSPSAAYSIVTPAGTLGVRGTTVEMQIGPGGQVMVLNVEGESEFCIDPSDRSTCKMLRNSCDFVIADPRTREITDPERVSPEAVIAFGGPDALPLIRDSDQLLPGFKRGQNECGLGKTAKAAVSGTERRFRSSFSQRCFGRIGECARCSHRAAGPLRTPGRR